MVYYLRLEVYMETKKIVGRPAGRVKTAKIEISIDPKVKDEFMKIVHNEGGTASGTIGMWIYEYINKSKNER